MSKKCQKCKNYVNETYKALCIPCYIEFEKELKTNKYSEITKNAFRKKREELENIGHEYDSMIKDNCFICGKKLKSGIERYYNYGNCCQKCDIRASKVARKQLESEFENWKEN